MASNRRYLWVGVIGGAVAVTVAWVYRRQVSAAIWGDPEADFQAELKQLIQDNARALLKANTRLKTQAKAWTSRLKQMQLEGGADKKKRDSGGGDEGKDGSDGPMSAYYHFDSNGNKLPNKWDTFDIDAALQEVDDEPTGGPTLQRPQDLLKEVAQLEGDAEAVLAQLDQVRGEADVKAWRKKHVQSMQRVLKVLDESKAVFSDAAGRTE